MSSTTQNAAGNVGKSVWYYTASAIGILITFGFGMLPPIGPITPMGMKVLGIFIGMLFLWSFVSVLWPSLLGIVALMISGYAPARQILHMSFGDTVPNLLLFAMILFGGIQHAGVTRYISRWFLTRKVINGKPVMFSFVFIFTTYALSALASTTAALLFMWAVLYSVLTDVGYKKGEKYTSLMVIGVLFGAISGQAAKPFVGSALMILGAFEKTSGFQVDFPQYMLYGFIMSTVGTILYSLMMKFIFRPDMSKIKDISIERFMRDKLPPMDLRQKIMFSALFGYLLMVILPSSLPKSIWIVSFLAQFGALGMVLMFVVGLSLFKIGDKPVMEFKEVASKYVVWDVYFLVCMAMAISGAMANKSTGITEFLKLSLDPLLGGHSLIGFVVILIVFGVVITQLANNGVMGVLLMPVVTLFSQEAGGNPEAITTMIIFAMHIAILTPAASPYAAMLYGNKDWIDGGDVFKYGLAIVLMTILMFTVIGVPVMNIVY
ncbi:hypothetical protein LJC48_05545 [Desulfovibrio sp. OttesenSCG-928-C06]|nr:hypothetical protein [Desulfovibrio sp. OttesenSCG-928-C06]